MVLLPSAKSPRMAGTAIGAASRENLKTWLANGRASPAGYLRYLLRLTINNKQSMKSGDFLQGPISKKSELVQTVNFTSFLNAVS